MELIRRLLRRLTRWIRSLARRLFRRLLKGKTKRSRGGNTPLSAGQRLLLDTRLAFGSRAQMPVPELLAALTERRYVYVAWSPADLVERLAAHGVPVTGQGRQQTIRRAAVIAAGKK